VPQLCSVVGDGNEHIIRQQFPGQGQLAETSIHHEQLQARRTEVRIVKFKRGQIDGAQLGRVSLPEDQIVGNTGAELDFFSYLQTLDIGFGYRRNVVQRQRVSCKIL